MSELRYFAYPDMGKVLLDKHCYHQAVRVGDCIECAGQGGWNPKTGDMKKDLYEEIDQAFDNVELALKDAGGKGWSQVYRVRSYHTDMSHDALMHTVENIKKRVTTHKPIFTCVGVTQLGVEGMRVEIEVAAYAPAQKEAKTDA
ncbi:YjgF-like protein [Sodiomyces alkalinus F11]|uniref:YjgF-like protein n=1 Tax=Sodiomyces alkalinus (strain CBS 110278 / VKM F-3762 / F11) TaxID=1314773 RepID=A0A3N2PKM4_SODAK|nr:YjgF-like protein [Sodiomyces alkalinus F11]ROT35059.1 YjgF-like protein [Sodiomyces alkalinus F11]